MLISPISNIQYTNKSQLLTSRPSFKANLKTVKAPIGILKRDTKFLVEDILHAHRDILAKLELKTEKGLEILAQKYPDVRIGNVLAFHNCGEDKNTIIINVGEVEKNKGLVYLSRRLGNRRSEKHTILEAFMLDGNERMIKDFNKEYAERFPAEREYYTQEEIESLGKEEGLNKLLQELDFAMLKFRKFLDKNMDEHLKLPDGKIPYQVASNLRQALNIGNEIEELSKNINRLKLLELYKEFPQYCACTGLRSYMFKDLGEDKVTINLSQVNRQDENLKRLSVYDKKGKPITSFLIKNDEKFISNLTKTDPTYIPFKYAYADSNEVEKKYLPEFNKYLKLYMDKLVEYKGFLESYLKSQQDKKKVGKLSTEVQFVLKDSLTLANAAKKTLEKINPKKAIFIKRNVGNLGLDFERRGFWFNDVENGETLQLLPVNNKRHENLCRLTIINNETNEVKMYLIKDGMFIVRNYNQNAPENIPMKLFYMSTFEMEDINLEHRCRFIKGKLEELNAQADYAFENRNMPIKREKTEKQNKKVNKQLIIRECKKQFNAALRNLDSGIENFNDSLRIIQEKIVQFYNKKGEL